MKSTIRFAIIGCGKITARHLEALATTPGCELVAVTDRVKERADEVGFKYKVPSYTDYLTMLREHDCDVVSVLTPSGTHSQVAHDVLSAGRHVVVEKPMTLRVSDAKRLLKHTERVGKNVFVVHQYRFHPAVQYLYDAVNTGRLGRITLVTGRIRWCRPQSYYDESSWRGTWAMDGGVIANQACHHVDLFSWIGGPIHSLHAVGTQRLSNIETEDVAVVSFRFESGALGVMEATTATRPHDIECSLSVLGEHGTVEIGGTATNQLKVWSFTKPLPEDEHIMREYGEKVDARSKIGHKRFYEELVASLSAGKPFSVDGLEAYKTVEIINAIYDSMETGERIQFPYEGEHSRLGLRLSAL